MSSLSTTVMRHSVVGRRCLSLFTTMVPAVPAPRTTRDLMVVVMLRRYPHGYPDRCEPRDNGAVMCETKACLTRDFVDDGVSPRRPVASRPSVGLEPPTEEPGHERQEDVRHPRRREQGRDEDPEHHG